MTLKKKEVADELNTENTDMVLDTRVDDKIEEFRANCEHAMDMVLLGQIFQRKYYNANCTIREFEVGDKVLINQQKTGLLRNIKRHRKIIDLV